MSSPKTSTYEWHAGAKTILCNRILDSGRIANRFRRALFEFLASAWIESPGKSYVAKELEFEVIKRVPDYVAIAPRRKISGEAKGLNNRNAFYQHIHRLDEELQEILPDVCADATLSIEEHDYRLRVTGLAPYWWVEPEKTHSVALLIANASDWFSGFLSKGILEWLPPDLDLITDAANDDDDREAAILKRLLEKCRGLILVPVLNRLDSDVVRTLQFFPTVLLDRYLDGVTSIPSVHHDDYTAGRLAGRILKANQCSHVWVIQQKSPDRDGTQPLTAVLDRVRGCQDEQERGVMRVEDIPAAGSQEAGGEKSLASVRDRIRKEDGIFATTDRLAVGCRHFLADLPSDRRPKAENIISFEGQSSGDFIDPPLTSIFGDPQVLGELAIRLLLQRMATTARPNFSHYVLEPKLLTPKGRYRTKSEITNWLGSDRFKPFDPREHYAKKGGEPVDRIRVVREAKDIPLPKETLKNRYAQMMGVTETGN